MIDPAGKRQTDRARETAREVRFVQDFLDRSSDPGDQLVRCIMLCGACPLMSHDPTRGVHDSHASERAADIDADGHMPGFVSHGRTLNRTGRGVSDLVECKTGDRLVRLMG